MNIDINTAIELVGAMMVSASIAISAKTYAPVDQLLGAIQSHVERWQQYRSQAASNRPVWLQSVFVHNQDSVWPRMVIALNGINWLAGLDYKPWFQAIVRRMERLCQRASYPYGLMPKEWSRAQFVIAILGIPICLSSFGGILVWMVAVFAIPGLLYGIAIRRKQQISQAVPDWLLAIALLLECGTDIARALKLSTASVQGPLSIELQRASTEHELGMGLHEAILGLAQRCEQESLSDVAIAIEINQQYGGALAPLFQRTGQRARAQLWQVLERRALETPVRILPAMMLIFAVIFLLLIAPIVSIWNTGF